MSSKVYVKKIELSSSGMVIAEVYAGDHRCGLRFFNSLFRTQKALARKFRRAHKWADALIKDYQKFKT